MAKRKSTTAGALVRSPGAGVAACPPVSRLLDAYLAGRSPRTLDAYRRDLESFRRWAGAPTVTAAAEGLLAHGHGLANEAVLRYRGDMGERGLAPATINRRLAAVRSLVKLARVLGMVPWTLEVPGVRGETLRDTRGPGLEVVRAMVGAAEGSAGAGDRKGARDLAAVRLMCDCGLRRGEVVGLDVEHVDLPGARVWILGKGRAGREAVTLPAPTLAVVAAWIEARGAEPGPLFVRLDRGAGRLPGRLSGLGAWKMIREMGEAVGAQVRPHGLRHVAITAALDATGGDVRAAAKFSRHRDLRTLAKYDDNRQDIAGQVAAKVAAAVSGH